MVSIAEREREKMNIRSDRRYEEKKKTHAEREKEKTQRLEKFFCCIFSPTFSCKSCTLSATV